MESTKRRIRESRFDHRRWKLKAGDEVKTTEEYERGAFHGTILFFHKDLVFVRKSNGKLCAISPYWLERIKKDAKRHAKHLRSPQ